MSDEKKYIPKKGDILLKILSERKIHVVKPEKLNNETSKLDILQAFIVRNI